MYPNQRVISNGFKVLCRSTSDQLHSVNTTNSIAKYWSNQSNQRAFLDQFCNENNISSPEDWSKISVNQIKEAGGNIILEKYPSMFAMLEQLYPENKWNIFQTTKKLPSGFWKDEDNQRLYLDHLSKKLKISNLEDWKKVTEYVLKKNGGSGLLKYYSNVHEALEKLYPEENWNIFNRKRLPNDFWNSLENQRKFMNFVKQKLNIQKMEDWYSVKTLDIKELGGSRLLHIYPSIEDLFTTIFPNYEWDFTKFVKVPSFFWKNVNNQKIWLQNLGEKLNIKELSEWQNYSSKTIIENGGRGLIDEYQNYFDMLSGIYPDYNWSFLHQKRISKFFFESEDNQREFILQLLKNEKIKAEDLRESHFRNRKGGPALLDRYVSIPQMLSILFKDKNWDHILHDKSRDDYWRNHTNQRNFFETIKNQNQILSIYQWKKITIVQIIKSGGSELLKKYKNLPNALSICYPNIDWSFLDKNKLNEYWKNVNNQKLFLNELCKLKNISLFDEWFSITYQDIYDLYGHLFIQQYDCIYSALCFLYPDYSWNILDAVALPSTCYHSLTIQKDILDRIFEKLNFSSIYDWSSFTPSMLIKMKGGPLLSIYSSIYQMLSSVYPTENWNFLLSETIKTKNDENNKELQNDLHNKEQSLSITKDSIITNDSDLYFSDIENQKRFLNNFAQSFCIEDDKQWLDISQDEINNFQVENNNFLINGSELLLKYNHSIYNMLSSIFKDKTWNFFEEYYDSIENQKKEFKKIENSLQIKKLNDWNFITFDQFKKEENSLFLLNKYNHSLNKLLCSIYPNEDWKKFNLHNSSFNSKENYKLFLETEVSNKFSIKQWSDWYSISFDDIHLHFGDFLTKTFSSMYFFINYYFSDNYSWNPLFFIDFNTNLHNSISIEHQKQWMNQLAKTLKLNEISDWKNISKEDFLQNGGHIILHYHNYNYLLLFQSLYPGKINWNDDDNQWKLEDSKNKIEKIKYGYLDDINNQKKYIKKLENYFCIQNQKDWINISEKQIKSITGGIKLLNQYKNNIYTMLSSIFPDKNWDFFSSRNSSKASYQAYWDLIENQRKQMNKIKDLLNLKNTNDFKNISLESFQTLDGSFEILQRYNHSYFDCLCSIYPDENWKIYDFYKKIPISYWNSIDNQKDYLENVIKEKLNIKEYKDWYDISFTQLTDHGGHIFSKLYSSIYHLVKTIYPEYSWNKLLFSNIKMKKNEKEENSSGRSSIIPSLEHQREYMNKISLQLNIKKTQDWEKISKLVFIKNGGHKILKYYKNSSTQKSLDKNSDYYLLLKTLYPDINWDKNKSIKISKQKLLHNKENQILFINQLKKKLNIFKNEDWQNVNETQLKLISGGSIILSLFNNNIYTMLSSLFPYENWEFFSSKNSSKASYHAFWDLIENQRKQMNKIASNLAISNVSDWKNISLFDFQQQNGSYEILQRYNHSLYEILCSIYPEEDWKIYDIYKKIPISYWNSIDNQKDFLQNVIGKKLNINEYKDWYDITLQQIKDHGGWFFASSYLNMFELLNQLIPEYSWNPLLFIQKRKKSSSSSDHNDFYNQQQLLLFSNSTIEQQREWMNDLAFSQLGFNSILDWKSISKPIFIKYGGLKILQLYNNDYIQMIKTIYPEYDWNIIDFDKIPKNHFDKISNQKEYLDTITKQLNIQNDDDWSSIYESHIRSFSGGNQLLSLYNNNLYTLLSSLYPNKNWDFFSKLDASKPSNNAYWDNLDNQRKLMDSISNQLNIKSKNDWKKITLQQFQDMYGSYEILKRYSSIFDALKSIYPDENWNFFEITNKIPISYWNSIDNQREFFNYLSNQLNIHSLDQWYSIPLQSIRKFGGSNLLASQGKIYDILKNVYPDFNWKIYLFIPIPNECFSDIQIHKDYLNDLAIQFNVKSKQDWSKITNSHFISYNGSWMLSIYNNIFNILCTLYPNEDWKVWESRPNIRSDFWDSDTIHSWVQQFENDNLITSPEHWYRVSQVQIRQAKGYGIINKFGSVENFLKYIYPDFNWDSNLILLKNKRASQRRLFVLIQRLFSLYEVIEEFNHPELTRISGSIVELDIFIPDLKLAFEYQGKHHYEELATWSGIELQKTRDKEKLDLCNLLGIHLISIPYWLDLTAEAIKETIPDQFNVHFKE